MLNSQKMGIELYENLGKLFYAVAMTDGSVHIKELDKLKQIVRDGWLEVDDIEDRYHSDAAHQIQTVFDWALEYGITCKSSFEKFEAFYTDYPKLFTPHTKNLILDTVNAIAYSFSGKNKSELVLLGKLQILFKD